MSLSSFEMLLARSRLFQHVTHEQVSLFAGRAQPHHFLANQVVAAQESLGTGLYVITKGSVDVVHDRGKPSERRLATLGEGEFFGELALLLERPRSATVVTREPTDFFTLLRWDFKDLALQSPELLWNLARAMAERLGGTDEVLEALEVGRRPQRATENIVHPEGRAGEHLLARS